MVLAVPLIGSNLAQMAVGITDTVMLGWYDVTALAAVTLANSVYFLIFLVGSGFAWAVMPLVAEAAESGDEQQVRRVTRMALWLSLAYAAIFIPPLMISERMFLAMGQEADVSALAQDYLRINGFALVPALVVVVLKSLLSAVERAGIVLWATLAGAAVNAVANYALIFGNWGAPELGVRGAAIASLSVGVVQAALLALYAIRRLPQFDLFRRLWRPDWPVLGRVLRLGAPIGLTSFAEAGLFSASAIMVGWIGAVPLAAHGVAMLLTGAAFMLQVGLSQAATVRAGRALGRGDPAGLRSGARIAILMCLVFALASAALFLAAPELLIMGFLDRAEPAAPLVMAAGVTLLAVAALFQVVDGMQALALGLLRGIQDTAVPMVLASISYWGIGLPVGYLLGFPLGHGAPGVWFGLVVGLACAAVLLMARFWWLSARIPVTPVPPGGTAPPANARPLA
nr:MATE family efflux transporter [Pseudoroseicyclus aestuarii]